jgi:SAM-dependent methyltransferase
MAPPASVPHEGYQTLQRLDASVHYNEWLGQKFRAHLGNRVLEVGAGIGTVTRQIEAGRERVVALEIEPVYVGHLKNAFRDKPHVRPYLADVAQADWDDLKAEQIDSILLSNVLEHIEDDAGAVARFARLLQPGNALVIYVPALPFLYGSMDEAVGHFRRYTPSTLRRVLEDNGFALERLEWMNVLGIPGWLVNGRLLKRRSVPPFQHKVY